MDKVVIWGAGNYCKLLLKNKQLDDYTIIKIVDSDSNKWGMKIEKIEVDSPECFAQLSYDKVIIAVKSYKPIIEKLVYELKVAQDKIFFYDYDNNKMRNINESGVELKKDNTASLERKLFEKIAAQVIEEDLLLECYQAGEFDDYKKVIVVGNEYEYNRIRVFFEQEEKGRIVELEDKKSMVQENSKYILTAETYRLDWERLLSMGGTPEQCVVIPLFDVKNTILV